MDMIQEYMKKCADGWHEWGYNTRDGRHGERPVGEQVCIHCGVAYSTFLNSVKSHTEPISESPRPTGEEELKKLEDWLVREICIKQSDRKRIDKELIKRGEFEVETRKRVKRVLSLAREETFKKILNDLYELREIEQAEEGKFTLDYIVKMIEVKLYSLSNQSKDEKSI